MAITVATIWSNTKKRTGRDDITEAECTSLIEAILYDLSHSFGFLETTAFLVIAANARGVTLTTGTRAVIGVQDSSGNTLLPISMSEYLQWVNQDPAAGTAMKRWTVFDEMLYIHPKMATEQTLTVFYSYETNNTTTIAFPDRFQEAIIEGVCFKMYEMRGLLGQAPEANTHKQLYDEQKTILINSYKERKGVA